MTCFVLSLSVLSQSALKAACRKKKKRCTRFSLYCQLISFYSVFPCSVLSCPILPCSDLIFPILSCSDLICSVPSQSVLRATCRKKKERCTHLSLYCPVLLLPVLSCSVLFWPDLFCSVTVCSVTVCSQGCMQKEEGKVYPPQPVLSGNLILQRLLLLLHQQFLVHHGGEVACHLLLVFRHARVAGRGSSGHGPRRRNPVAAVVRRVSRTTWEKTESPTSVAVGPTSL